MAWWLEEQKQALGTAESQLCPLLAVWKNGVKKPESVSLPLELGQNAAMGIALGRGSPQEVLHKIVLCPYTLKKWVMPFVGTEI